MRLKSLAPLTPSGTNRYFRKVAANNGISYTLVDITDLKILENSIKENTKVRRVTIPADDVNMELLSFGECLWDWVKKVCNK